MTKAFRCDVCGKYEDGMPTAYVHRSFKVLELCLRCNMNLNKKLKEMKKGK